MKCRYFNCLMALCSLLWQLSLPGSVMQGWAEQGPSTQQAARATRCVAFWVLPALPPSQPICGGHVPVMECTWPVGWAEAYQVWCRLRGCFLCPVAGAASGGGAVCAGDEAVVGKTSSAWLAWRLQVAVHLTLSARNLDLHLRAKWLC